jgi:hypothetical protein
VTETALLPVQEELLRLEPIFHNTEFGDSREDYDARMSDDYWQVGASGQVYERAAVLRTVTERGRVAGDEHWEINDPCCRALGDGTYLLTYHLDQDGRLTRRTTIWRRGPERWQILYHQGTVISDGLEPVTA